ncbi:hypothetical protein DPEC_G00209620 [Dallia pectoralis]|uniref:Uncharacterized protein n=1 Tax=Dallia pectoralis TaxID=75939 RepID=A0ACC2G5N2_DALPE|nr:hypothetical protein DPEC_G00209620 [Dallia pectoralis]
MTGQYLLPCGSGQCSVLASELIKQASPPQNAVQNVPTSTKHNPESSCLSWKRLRESLDQQLKQSNHKRPKLVVKDPSALTHIAATKEEQAHWYISSDIWPQGAG